MAFRLVVAALLTLLSACSTTREVRLDTSQGELFTHVPIQDEADPVELDEDAFILALSEEAREVRPAARPLDAARQWSGVPERSGWYRYEGRSQRLLPLGAENHLALKLSPSDVELKRQYLQWCSRSWGAGDCLRLLVDSPGLDSDGKYTLAMAIAQGSVLGEMRQAFGEMVDPQAVLATIASAVTMYMVLWALPEPVSKGVAATLTVALVAYLGVDTVWRLIDGWLVLMKEVDRATTFEEVQKAGEKYGSVMGRSAARAFVLLATVAVGNTAAGMAARLPTLPGVGQASVMAETQLGIQYAAAGQVRTVAGSGKQWHHIVEQTPGNVKRFGPQALHNTTNVIPLEKALHTRVSAFYSSIRRDVTGSPMTVRQWLSTQSYEAQRDFGLLAIQNISKGIW